jgi:two-component system, cell cycle sensor histidine kinase and response regulator CckA
VSRISKTYQRAGAILIAAVICSSLAVLYVANRLPPIPNRVLRIGFEQNPPLQFRSNDGLTGLGVETVNTAAKRAGIRIQWVETGTSSEASFRKGLVDLWPVMADLPERRKFIHFSRPWLHSGHAVLVRSGAPIPGTDFAGRIAVFRLPLHVRMAQREFPSAQLVMMPEAIDVLRQVCKGTVGGGFLEFRTALGALQSRIPECLGVSIRTQILANLTNQLALASTFEAAGAAEALRREIGDMFRDGTMALIMAKYSYYGLDDTWAAYDAMEAASRARLIGFGVSGLTLLLAVVIWRALSLRQHRRAEAVLRESEERFRNMADTAPVMIWVTGPDKGITFVNKTWLQFTGRTIEQELGNGWAEAVHPDDTGRCFETFSTAFDARRHFTLECRFLRADGRYRSILCTGIPRFASNGEFVGYIGSDIDITDLQSEERFRQLAENIDEVFWMLDLSSNRVLYVSPAFEKIWGVSASPLYQNPSWLLETVHPEDKDLVAEYLSKMRSEFAEVSYRIVRPEGGIRWILDRAFLVRTREGQAYRVAGIAEDVTAQRELEEHLSQSNKMEAVGRLAGGVAHDFNNLLTIIGGYSQMLLDHTPSGDPRRGQFEQILTAANRASILTKQLLAFSRRQVLQPRLVNLNHLVTSMNAMLGRIIGESVRIETALDPGIVSIQADPHQLEQVVMNLAVNARDAMPNGGVFRIETSVAPADHPAKDAGGEETGRRVRLRISDTGCGMDERIRERVFEPFFTTKGVGKGTGLGLSTVYGIVHQNQGTIQVASTPGHGTVFDLHFPAAPEGMAEEAAAPKPRLKPEAGATILLAEDEPAVRGLVRVTLQQLGYQVLEAGDGYQALKLVEGNDIRIHLLLTDVIMPLMNGHELAQRLTALRPGTKVLYMSGYTDDVLAFHGIAPEIDFIQKPFSPADLADKIERVLSAGKSAGGSAG